MTESEVEVWKWEGGHGGEGAEVEGCGQKWNGGSENGSGRAEVEERGWKWKGRSGMTELGSGSGSAEVEGRERREEGEGGGRRGGREGKGKQRRRDRCGRRWNLSFRMPGCSSFVVGRLTDLWVKERRMNVGMGFKFDVAI